MGQFRLLVLRAVLLTLSIAAGPLSPAQVLVTVGGNTGSVTSIIPIGDEIWLAGENGASRVDRKTNRAVPLAGITGWVTSIVPIGDEIWLGGQYGVFRMDRKTNQAVPLAGIMGIVNSILPIGDEIWLGRDKGLIRVDRKTNRAVQLAGNAGSVNSIIPIGDEIWLADENGASRVDRKTNRAVPLAGITGWVTSIVPIGDEIWLGGQYGVFRMDRKTNQAVPLAGIMGIVYSIVPIGNEIWLGGDEGLFRVDRKTNQAVQLVRNTGIVFSVVSIGDEIWLGGANGVFRLDPKASLTVELAGSIPLASRLWGVPVWFEGDTHPIVHSAGQTGEDKYDISQAVPLVMVATDKATLLKKLKDDANWTKVTETDPRIPLTPGPVTLFFAVKDSWGNTIGGAEPYPVHGWVVPTWTLSVLLPFLAIGLCLVCLALAPWIRYCHMLLMNPFLRNWASFGVIPILLTAMPPVRRHIFRRYLRTMARSDKFKLPGVKYIVPEERFTPARFAETLSQSQVIGLHGQSGIGKSAFLVFLAYECASAATAQRLLRRLTPVFVDLSIAGDLKPEAMVRAELRKYGDLIDEEIADALLDYGGFLFLFDGLNEVREGAQNAILQFADLHRNHNCSCISTQIVTDELRRVARLASVEPLSDSKVKELIRKQATDPATSQHRFDSEALIEKLTPASLALSSVPFQLELLMEIWAASQKVPQGIDELYSYALGSITDKEAWIARGHGDYPDILCGLAFTLLTERRPFDPEKDNLPDEVKSELKARRLFVDRGEAMEFRHDRIRAYLASHYFALRWRTILGNEKTLVDPNWDAMMEFHLEREQDSTRARDMTLLLAAKDIDSAIRLARWGRVNRPELFDGWQDELSQEVGKKVLGV